MKKSSEDYREGLTGTNPGYSDHQPIMYDDSPVSREQIPNPADMQVFSGFGAGPEDLQRGWIKPNIHNDPEYDMANYKERWTEFRVEDEDSDQGEQSFERNRQFRMKDRQTKGLFIRPHIPIER